MKYQKKTNNTVFYENWMVFFYQINELQNTNENEKIVMPLPVKHRVYHYFHIFLYKKDTAKEFSFPSPSASSSSKLLKIPWYFSIIQLQTLFNKNNAIWLKALLFTNSSYSWPVEMSCNAVGAFPKHKFIYLKQNSWTLNLYFPEIYVMMKF